MGRWVTRLFLLCLLMSGSQWLAAEVVPVSLDLDAEAESQYQVLLDDLKRVDRFETFAEETFHSAALVHRSDRDPLDILLRRTLALMEDLRQATGGPEFAEPAETLREIGEAADRVPATDQESRRELFNRLMLIRREIALSNPLLDFGKLLFIKRHRSTFNHMCDQYYGANALPGGGVYVLCNPFSREPAEANLLNSVAVTKGRLKGQSLSGGSFLSPELSFDGETVFFAYVECTGESGHVSHMDHANDGHWARGRCYHLFSFDIDANGLQATNLRQLTDGTFNDFDPCLLPNGRVAFVSERRGGYLRCGRACPSYTVHDMNPDGSDIRAISPHENNEWHPSLTHDGMILYTRWDYVDRHGCTAHHPWVMTPDGRDSRALHGNFSVKAKRADMELDLRAIPDSDKIVGTASPHHGQAFGSIIIVDPDVPDDDAMAPVRRITPDVGFPESQGGKQVYGTPWPLSEKYYLCVYDPAMRKGGKDNHSADHRNGSYGIYLLDAFGNKVLVYRDPEIACLSPMPLRETKRPQLIPATSQRLADDPPSDGAMAVLNVYETQHPWPQPTKITALRIFQIHPSSVPSGNPPHETGRRIAEAGDSVNLARRILGTVPVEDDGSAYFRVPAMKELYFQAIDEEGLAVQSMRSATWVQPGDLVVCHGCHEPRHQAPAVANPNVLALQRAPSIPKPDVDGTDPFSYPRLVQPVLDRKCVGCHSQNLAKGAPPLDDVIVEAQLSARGTTSVFRSYDSLIHDFAFWRYEDPYRTIPGKFGAKASKLYQMLSDGHHDVELSDQEMHRITVWLDSLSNFYGVYEREGGLAQLRGEIAHPTLE